MKVESLRSSSMGAWDFCQHRYFIEFGLGIRGETNLAALQGSIVHQCAELIAWKKLTLQQGKGSFYHPEFDRTFYLKPLTNEKILDLVYAQFQKQHPDKILPTGKNQCRRWLEKLLTMEGGAFDPMRQNIISPEQHFKFEIKKPWARYAVDGVEKYLEIQGTIDLVVQSDTIGKLYNLIDYKTGRRLNWGTGEEKTEKKLYKDTQLRLYHYAACYLYPNVEEVLATIVYINDGGSFTIPFSREDLPDTERMIQKYFEDIKRTTKPKLTESWRCQKFCFQKYQSPEDPSQNVCYFFRNKVHQIGLEKTVEQYADKEALGQYFGGGKVLKK